VQQVQRVVGVVEVELVMLTMILSDSLNHLELQQAAVQVLAGAWWQQVSRLVRVVVVLLQAQAQARARVLAVIEQQQEGVQVVVAQDG
jgi:hypothetical protein